MEMEFVALATLRSFVAKNAPQDDGLDRRATWSNRDRQAPRAAATQSHRHIVIETEDPPPKIEGRALAGTRYGAC